MAARKTFSYRPKEECAMRPCFGLPLAALMLLTIHGLAVAGEGPAEKAEPEGPPVDVVEMVLHPAPAPKPALKYRLTWPALDRRPGNAAWHYAKAGLLLAAPTNVSSEKWDKIIQWQSKTPGEPLPLEEIREMLEKYEAVLHEVQIGARRDRCYWEFPIRDAEENVLEILLPELQVTRNLTRLLGLKARLEMAERNYDEAIAALRTGYTMAWHVGQNPYVVGGLVGIANAGIISKQMEMLIQSPDVPNLYWALTALPRPLVDLRDEFEIEEDLAYWVFPELQQVDGRVRTPDQWRADFDEFVSKYNSLMKMLPPAEKRAEEINAEALLEEAYPRARRALLARGRTAEQVDAMAPAEVLLVVAAETYDELRDELFKWSHVPYWEAEQNFERMEELLRGEHPRREVVVPLASVLLPAMEATQYAVAKNERDLDALRCIEAIRLYAAAHDGKLPKRLGDITDVPVPVNPVTGKPFPYRLEGDAAILEGDGRPGRYRRRYLLKLAE